MHLSQFTHKSKTYAGTQAGPKINLSSIIHAAKKNDYERKSFLQILYFIRISFSIVFHNNYQVMKNLTNLPQSVISRVKLLYRYGYRLEQKENMTDPLKKIELFKVGCYFRELLTSHPFKAIASPAYIVASLENLNEVSADFFCPVKKCFEFACEANFRKSTIPEYKKEYQEIENRYKDAVIASLGPGPD